MRNQRNEQKGALDAPFHFNHQTLELLKQFQYSGWQLVSLGQDRGGSLLQGLLLGQLGSFGSEVSILNATAGSGGVLGDALQVGYGAVETVLNGTQCGALAVDLLDGSVQSLYRLLRITGGQDVQITNGGLGFAGVRSTGNQAQIRQSTSVTSRNHDVAFAAEGNFAIGGFLQLHQRWRC